MKRFVMLAALLAAACQPLPDDGDPGVVQTSAEAAAACAVRGGEMLPQGRMQTLQCVVSYADAGQRCTDGDDCQGDCRIEDADAPQAGAAAVGQCQAASGRFGCYTTVEGGRAQAAICVD